MTRAYLPYHPPFDFAGLLETYAAHQVGDLEWFDGERMHRVIERGGRVGRITIADDPARGALVVDVEFPDPAAQSWIHARVRRMFDLDLDPDQLAERLGSDPAFAAMLETMPGVRLASGWDPFEIAITTILGQLVSVARGRALTAELIALAGVDLGHEMNGRAVKRFPTPTELAAADLTALKTTGARKRCLNAFAAAVRDGDLSLAPDQDVEAFVARALKIPGVGPWTAQYMALKVLRDADRFPSSDLILARALLTHAPERIHAMSPWRGYVAALLWRASTLAKART